MAFLDLIAEPGPRFIIVFALVMLTVLGGACFLMKLAGRVPPCEHCGGAGKFPARGDDGRDVGSYYHCDCQNTIR